jgi:hypothetical protein
MQHQNFQKLKLAVGVLAVAACARTATVEAGGEVAPATPVTSRFLPAGTTMNVRINNSIGTRSSRDGDSFTGTLISPVIAEDGSRAVPAGATLTGHVTGVHHAAIPTEQSVIRLHFDNLTFDGRTYPFDGAISNVTVDKESVAPNTNSTVRGAVTGAAVGAVLGGIVSGVELSKIITGGLLGAAAGTVISLGTGSSESVIPAGSLMTVQATNGLQLR